MPRWFAHLLVVSGWLLTPILAWGASYVGLLVSARLAVHFAEPLIMLAVAALGAAASGLVALTVWVRFMRRVPHLLSHHMAARTAEERGTIAAAH